ncbi:MAG: methionine--tRNA ligase [Euryarchaeota archaeon]|nr:methionine--tRNA ligase [Euryarchaeota archaeon]
MSDGDHVLVCVAWPYANGPLHLGHVAGCYLPPDIYARFERARGNRVLMVSGSDEHGTPITVTAEQEGVSPQDIVDEYHRINTQALLDLGCTWIPNIDRRGIGYGGSLFNQTSDTRHKEKVQENFMLLYNAGFFEKRTMQQYFEVHPSGGGRFLPDRYIEGTCPSCGEDGARGDQCDACGATYESYELKNPVSKMNPELTVEIRDTEHLFYRLDLFQNALEQHAENNHAVWKPNVRAMTKQWLDMGLRPRAVTRDLEWGIDVPLDGEDWNSKCIYVWFEAVQGYLTCSQIWSESFGDGNTWEQWWIENNDTIQRHYYFLGKDNVPFHTVIWPAILIGLNHARSGKTADEPVELPSEGSLRLEDNVPAMEYLMLAGGQFSKSRKHAIWVPSFLERFDPDTLRYYLSINMPESHDTDFTWGEFVDRINNELIATYGNFVNRVLSLSSRLPDTPGGESLPAFDNTELYEDLCKTLEKLHSDMTTSLERHRYKEALRTAMTAAQHGNQLLQSSMPWKHLKTEVGSEGRVESLSSLAFGWRICRYLAIVTQPFLPFSAQKLWDMLGIEQDLHDATWQEAIDWSAQLNNPSSSYEPLFKRLDVDEIVQEEQSLVEENEESSAVTHAVKGGKKEKKSMKNEAPEGIEYLDFDTFMKVELRVGRILSVEDHPNADRLYVVKLDDGSEDGRTICAGIKAYYSAEELLNKSVVFVANLQPRPLRGVVSQGMMLAADDGNDTVRLVTLDGDIATGSLVR